MPTYTADPATYDATMIVGDTWLITCTLSDSSGVAVDLTGVTGVASIRAEPGNVEILAPTVTVTVAASGQFTIGATASSTAGLVPGKYKYAARLTWGDGTVRTVIEGALTLRRAVVA